MILVVLRIMAMTYNLHILVLVIAASITGALGDGPFTLNSLPAYSSLPSCVQTTFFDPPGPGLAGWMDCPEDDFCVCDPDSSSLAHELLSISVSLNCGTSTELYISSATSVYDSYCSDAHITSVIIPQAWTVLTTVPARDNDFSVSELAWFTTMDTCVQHCFDWGSEVANDDILHQLGCFPFEYNDCLCNTKYTSAASTILERCVSRRCYWSSSTIDPMTWTSWASDAVARYEEYCSAFNSGIKIPTVKATITSAEIIGGPSATGRSNTGFATQTAIGVSGTKKNSGSSIKFSFQFASGLVCLVLGKLLIV